MKQRTIGLALAAAFLLPAGAAAQWRGGPYRDDPYYRGQGRRPAGGLIDRVLNDLGRARSYGYVDNHERKHFEQAQKDLMRFQDNWARGRFDRSRLDGAIDNLKDLANSRQVHPRDREIFIRDIADLRAFRANQGAYRGYRGGLPY